LFNDEADFVGDGSWRPDAVVRLIHQEGNEGGGPLADRRDSEA
jgi:hypothetical protein